MTRAAEWRALIQLTDVPRTRYHLHFASRLVHAKIPLPERAQASRRRALAAAHQGVEADLPLGRAGADREPVAPGVEREREDDPAAEDRGPRRRDGGGPVVGVYLGA